MKKVYVRFYDANNLGDDLFIQILSERYVNKFLLNKQRSNIKYFKKNSNVKFYGNCYTNKLFNVIGNVLNIVNFRILKSLRPNDIFLYIGGSIFIEDNNLDLWKKEENFYKRINTPYYIIGSNVGPYHSPDFKKIIRKIIGGAKDVCFRDRASYEEFSDVLSTRCATDVVFSLDVAGIIASTNRTAIFSIMNGDKRFSQEITDKYEKEIINMTRNLVDSGYEVIYMSFCKSEGDETAINRIILDLDDSLTSHITTYQYRGNFMEALNLIGKSEIMIGTRLHASVLGLKLGKKVLPLAYSAKTMNTLDDMHFQGPIIDINKIDKFNGCTFDFDSLKVNSIEEQIKLAELQFQELDKVLVKRVRYE